MMRDDVTKSIPILLAAHRLFATADFDPLSQRWLEANGINISAVENLAGPIVRTTGSFIEDWYEPDPLGENCFALAVHGEDAETVIDIVAWSARETDIFATQFGRAPVLGIDQLFNPASYVSEKHCHVWRSPMRWLQEGCKGVVILDYQKARPLLSEAPGSLAIEDVEFAHELVTAGIVKASRLFVPMREGVSA